MNELKRLRQKYHLTPARLAWFSRITSKRLSELETTSDMKEQELKKLISGFLTLGIDATDELICIYEAKDNETY